MKEETKKIVKPKTYSVEDMYIYFINNMVKDNPHLVIKGKSRENKITRFSSIYHYYDNEIKYIDKQIEIKKDYLNSLLDEDHNFFVEGDILDTKLEIKEFESKKKELLLKSRQIKKIIDYKIFKSILTTYNKLAGEEIIHGGKVSLLNGLGYLSGRRVERNYNNKSVDWKETDKLRDNEGNLPKDKNGKTIMVYYTSEEWCRVAWGKTNGIKNISVYAFTPSGGQKGKGFRQAFSKAIKDNPILSLAFEFRPKIEKERK